MNEVIERVDTPPAQHHHAITPSNPAYLLQLAVEQGADLDKLERLMALQERWEADQARKAYNAAFTAFKAEAVKILKGRKVTDGPLKGKSYAELHDVVDAVTPALSAHGLSAAWKLTKDEKDWLEVTCTLKHVGGHAESVSMGGSPDVGGAKNAIQARASSVTYLQRYTLKAITGLSEHDDDTDGNPKPADISCLLSGLRATTTDEAALAFWNANKAGLDPTAAAQFKAATVAHRKHLGAAK